MLGGEHHINELKEIKERIYQDKKIEFILTSLGCWGINYEQSGSLIVAALPNGDNKRSVQVRNNKYLNTSIRTRGVQGDIYTLVSYIKYNSIDSSYIPKAKEWLCTICGYAEYLEEVGWIEEGIKKVNWNDWLIKNKINKNIEYHNKVIDRSILNKYIFLPYLDWIKEGISYRTQIEFEVGFDIESERVIFPIHNQNGDLIGVKGRYIGSDKDIEQSKKYIYLYPCNKSIELYNYHRAIKHIKKKKEVIVFEGAKSVMKAHSMGIYNCVSIEGDQISTQQIRLLKDMGLSVHIILAFDADKDKKFIKEQAKNIKGRLLSVIYDKDNLLGDKELKNSPVDLGKRVFMELYNNYRYRLEG